MGLQPRGSHVWLWRALLGCVGKAADQLHMHGWEIVNVPTTDAVRAALTRKPTAMLLPDETGSRERLPDRCEGSGGQAEAERWCWSEQHERRRPSGSPSLSARVMWPKAMAYTNCLPLLRAESNENGVKREPRQCLGSVFFSAIIKRILASEPHGNIIRKLLAVLNCKLQKGPDGSSEVTNPSSSIPFSVGFRFARPMHEEDPMRLPLPIAALGVLTMAAIAAPADFPPPSKLPSNPEMPDPTVMLDGTKITTQKDWETNADLNSRNCSSTTCMAGTRPSPKK